MEAGQIEWVVDGRKFNRYRMMEYIAVQVSMGDSLPEVCERIGMPDMRTVYSWFDNHPEFEREMRRAEEIRGHRLGERALRIAEATDRENVAADKLRVETLSKAAARTNTRFQDKQLTQVVDEFANLSVDQLKARVMRMLQANPDLADTIAHQTLSGPDVPEIDVQPDELETPTLGCDQSDTPDEADS